MNNNEAVINNASQEPQDGVNNTKQEKTFTQSQLEEIIRERLTRERKVNESLESVKHLLKSVSERGLIKGDSYAEMAKELVEKLESKRENPNDACDEVSEKDETSAVADADGKKADGNVAGNNESVKKNESEQSFVQVLARIKAKYPKGAVEKLLEGDLFEKFAKGRNGSMEEIFDDYYSFFNEAKRESVVSDETGFQDFASTAFSSHSGAADGGSNLTKQQMEIAKSAGMSYREYQNLLESIPKRTGRTF